MLQLQEECVPDPILVVEDNHFLRHVLCTLLTEEGHGVTGVGDGLAALEHLRAHPCQIVLTDWVMPGMDGLALCRAIRELPRDSYTYVILLTAQESKADLVAGLESGADEYLIKPVDEAELRARLKIAQRILNLERSLKLSLEEIKNLSVKDPLTELYNRRYLAERLPQEIKRAARYGRDLSLIMLDLDHFKAVNDRHGHGTGDGVLKACAAVLQEAIRQEVDWAARFGGEEFLLILPETDHGGALVVAERLREQFARQPLRIADVEIPLSASFGVATYPHDRRATLGAETLLEAADRALYQAKQGGRNRVCSIPL
jgi:two-component system, cell cycle response regulator